MIVEHNRYACDLQKQLRCTHHLSGPICTNVPYLEVCIAAGMGPSPDRATLGRSSAAPTSRTKFAPERYRCVAEPHYGLHQLLLLKEVTLSCNMALQSQFGAFFSSPCQQASVTIPSTTSEWTCGLKLSGTFNCSSKPPPAFHTTYPHLQSFQHLQCLDLVQLCDIAEKL